MKALPITLCAALALASCAPAPAPSQSVAAQVVTPAQWVAACADAPQGSDGWVKPAPPTRIYGNTYMVGTCGITALLVVTDDGAVLLDTGMPEAAPLIAANIEKVGVRLADVKWLLSSHEHLDHVGATAELQRMTGALTAALEPARQPLQTGEPWPYDPQATIIPRFTGFAIDSVIQDGGSITLGDTTFVAHSNPVHTPGSTSWTWQSCEGSRCQTMAYMDSLSTPAADDYRFTDHPDYVAGVRAAFAKAATVPCGVLITPHPEASNLAARLSGSAPLADPAGCAAYAARAEATFATRLAGEARP
ncbi:subclass B3 metallo-beta-lactamase [Alteraurantiacibacter buctensis]|uniref:Subclass B3 metallo-beta-lactamase n=1 Tax=Alteraurantiacibacter buctensis TaxID=1503981 RepID=A0A844YTD5_9SPHN|nr:subclass B3 metallo-beta-lactamase [Alteraurantiacibacter buctensis]MXO71585.1 subclass B3 metallo-beta-lactamase [Alteraurantiacibacter buctensis]